METFWVKASAHDDMSDSCEDSFSETIPESAGDGLLEEGFEKNADLASRLIGWNVEIFKKYLCRIIKYRHGLELSPEPRHRAGNSVTLDLEGSLLEEVQEVISLPKFNARAIQSMKKTTNDTDISQVAEDQLREYITTIIHMYRQNPFHSFQVRPTTFVFDVSSNEGSQLVRSLNSMLLM